MRPFLTVLVLMLSACDALEEAVNPTEVLPEYDLDLSATDEPPADASDPLPAQLTVATTYAAPNGNRFVPVQGAFPEVLSHELSLPEEVSWVVGLGDQDGLTGAAVTLSGQATLFRLSDGGVETLAEASLPAGMPPLMLSDGSDVDLFPAAPELSSSTHPTFVGSLDAGIAVSADGLRVLVNSGEAWVSGLEVRPLPDARIVVHGKQLALLAEATTAYAHGVLGDSIEAGAISLLDLDGTAEQSRVISLPEGDVVEGIWPISADVTGDGAADLVVTLSNAVGGARIGAWDDIADTWLLGPSIGTGYRWRHVIAVGPFAPSGQAEIAVVRTPHIGGILEFYSPGTPESLVVTATRSGVTSHRLGSRNLDMGLAGDFDGDGTPEVVLPDMSRGALVATQRIADGAEQRWTFELPVKVTSNLMAGAWGAGRTTLAAGLADGRVILYTSSP